MRWVRWLPLLAAGTILLLAVYPTTVPAAGSPLPTTAPSLAVREVLRLRPEDDPVVVLEGTALRDGMVVELPPGRFCGDLRLDKAVLLCGSEAGTTTWSGTITLAAGGEVRRLALEGAGQGTALTATGSLTLRQVCIKGYAAALSLTGEQDGPVTVLDLTAEDCGTGILFDRPIQSFYTDRARLRFSHVAEEMVFTGRFRLRGAFVVVGMVPDGQLDRLHLAD